MSQSFDCPNCQATLDYDSKSADLTVRCPYCSSTVIVPDSLRSRRGHTAAFSSGMQQAQVLAEVVQLAHSGRKIEAIKKIREAFGVGLKEAKDVVDAIERHEDIHLGGTSFHTEGVDFSTFTQTSFSEPAVQVNGRRGCMIFIVLLGVGILALAGFFAISARSVVDSVPEIIQEVQTLTEPITEEGAQIDEEFINSAIEEIINGEGALPGTDTGANAATEPDFAEVVLQFGGEEGVGPGFFNDTRALAMDGEGNIYTGDYSGGRIQVFDSTGKFLATWNAGSDLYMRGITADRQGIVYVINLGTVEMYNGLSGEFLGNAAVSGGPTDFETVTTGPDGSVYIVGEARLVRLDSSGNVTLDVAEPFANVPDFGTTHSGAAVDGAGNIYVLGREAIYKLNADGQFVDQIGSKGDAEDQFRTSPSAVAVDGKGRIFVQDFSGIKVFDGNGRYLDTINSPGIAFSMTVTDENDLLVMDRNGNEVRKYRLP